MFVIGFVDTSSYDSSQTSPEHEADRGPCMMIVVVVMGTNSDSADEQLLELHAAVARGYI